MTTTCISKTHYFRGIMWFTKSSPLYIKRKAKHVAEILWNRQRRRTINDLTVTLNFASGIPNDVRLSENLV
ncbi:MAG: hypothetical protein U0936_15445 [Planctomycetaceae bacterium]